MISSLEPKEGNNFPSATAGETITAIPVTVQWTKEGPETWKDSGNRLSPGQVLSAKIDRVLDDYVQACNLQ